MVEKLTNIADYLRKIPAAFLVAIESVLALILFLPEGVAKTLSVLGFRETFRVLLGPGFLLVSAFILARVYLYFYEDFAARREVKLLRKQLDKLTPEEKGYLAAYINQERNSIYVGIEDGVMSGLTAKGITYRASNAGDTLNGFAYNLQPWAREHLEKHRDLLEGHVGQPMTPQQKLHARY